MLNTSQLHGYARTRCLVLAAILPLLAGCATRTPHPYVQPSGWVGVGRIIDGDTFVTDKGITVDIDGIDTPELGSPGKAAEAGAREAWLLADYHLYGKQVWLRSHTIDSAGKTRADVRLMGNVPYAHYVRLYGFDKIARKSPSEASPLHVKVDPPPKDAESDPYFTRVSGFHGKGGFHLPPFWTHRITSRKQLEAFIAERAANPDNKWPGFTYVPRPVFHSTPPQPPRPMATRAAPLPPPRKIVESIRCQFSPIQELPDNVFLCRANINEHSNIICLHARPGQVGVGNDYHTPIFVAGHHQYTDLGNNERTIPSFATSPELALEVIAITDFVIPPFIAPPSTSIDAETFAGEVTDVVDGDTLTISLGLGREVKIRLAGIDSPEATQVHGQQARSALSQKVLGRTVHVRVTDADKYGRGVCDIFLGDRWINLEMVDEGWAWHWTASSKSPLLVTAQEVACAARRGLWADPSPVEPWVYREKYTR